MTKLSLPQDYANPDCYYCHGSGTVIDWVPYGDGNVPMTTICECVANLEEIEEEAAETNPDGGDNA